MTSQLDDERMEALFAAFGDAHASDDVKARTLRAVAHEVGCERDPHEVSIVHKEGDAHAPRGARVVAGNLFESKGQGDSSALPIASKNRLPYTARIVRLVAAAACLAALAVGGVAYALPTSNVTVAAGGSAVELGVNCFGITVSAVSEDAEAQRALDEAWVRNIPYGDSLGRVLDSLGTADSDSIQIKVETSDERARADMEKRAAEIVDEKPPAASAHDEAGFDSGESKPAEPAQPSQEESAGGEDLDVRGNPGAPSAPGPSGHDDRSGSEVAPASDSAALQGQGESPDGLGEQQSPEGPDAQGGDSRDSRER